jgi:Cu/Ag efflux protein CusF
MSKYVMRSAMVVSLAAVVLAFALSARAQQPQVAQKHAPSNLAMRREGTIESIDTAAGTVTIKLSTGETMTVTCDANCRFSIQGRAGVVIGPAGLKDLKVGDETVVLYSEKDGKPVALVFNHHPPVAKRPLPAGATRGAGGTIESIDAAAGTVTIKLGINYGGPGTITVTCDAGPAALKDLKIGDNAFLVYTEKDGKPVCHSVRTWPAPHQSLLGTITSIDAATGSVTIKEPEGWTATFTCAADCSFETNGGANKHATLSDLKVGDKVSAVCTKENGKVACHDLMDQQKLTP